MSTANDNHKIRPKAADSLRVKNLMTAETWRQKDEMRRKRLLDDAETRRLQRDAEIEAWKSKDDNIDND